MGFDGKAGWQDPAELAAAREAAKAMSDKAAGEDARTDKLAGAIVHGLGLVAEAIRSLVPRVPDAEGQPTRPVPAIPAGWGLPTEDDPDLDALLSNSGAEEANPESGGRDAATGTAEN